MKKIYFSFIFVFTFYISQAQNVTIPDVNFKNKLLAANSNNTIATDLSGNYFKIDSNNDNQIQESEALQVKKLDISASAIANLTGIISFANLEYLDFGSNQLTSFNLNGLNNLTNLTCSNNHLVSLDVTYLSNLKILFAYNCYLTSINVNGLTHLELLNCASNQLSNLNLINLPQLIGLECQNNLLQTLTVNHLTTLHGLLCNYNQLSSLDVSNLIFLENLQFSHNNLTSIDISNNPEIFSFDCSYNQLSVIDLTNAHKLQYSAFNGNLFTELDFSQVTYYLPASYHEFSFRDNPNLVFVNAKNGQSDYIYFSNLNCPNLHYLCADDIDVSTFATAIQQASVSNIQVNSYCSFTPGGSYNTITGHVSVDTNNDGCDPSDLYFPNVRINFSDGINSGASFTDDSGNYTFYNSSGNYTITPNVQNATYFAVTPPNAILNFPSIDNSTQTQNFCISPAGIHPDVDITIIPLLRPRPGFDCSYQLVYKNKGNQIISGDINFTFNDAVLDFIDAYPMPDNQSTDNLNWNYTDLMPFESRSITFTLNLNGPMETPAVNIGDILDFSAMINPVSDDETPEDNVFSISQMVNGSYDPNDKICLEGTSISTLEVGDYLHYVINFQNTGTAEAENIVVKDMIDITKFDINTFQLTATSHPQITRITNNKVEFIFDGINLPAQQTNEAASHGYVAFKIKTKSNLVVGNTVTNRASIYFDYNFPIITNLTSTTVALLGIGEFENTSVNIYPNPAKSTVTISSKDTITSIQLFDVQGRLILSESNNSLEVNLDLTQQYSGIYFVKVKTVNGVKTKKIIKE